MPDIKAQNEKALASVKAIYDAAEQAKSDALRAKGAADDAADAAELADGKADEAKASALAAGKAAYGALTQLSLVEDVVGTLAWITKHGRYALTADETVTPGKHYFIKTGDSYSLVISPAADPKTAGYYELVSVDEALSNYVASHLSLTDQGLWVTKDNNAYKILLASDGMKVYDSGGNLVATFGESIRFSSSRPQYIGGEDAFIIFFDSDNDGVPDAINIGGNNVTFLGNRRLSDLISSLDDAEKTATNYITDISNQGIWVTPVDKKPGTSNASGVHITDSVDIVRNGERVASYGESAVIGKEDAAYMDISSTMIQGVTEEKNALFQIDLHGGDFIDQYKMVSGLDEYETLFDQDEEYAGGGGLLIVASPDNLDLSKYTAGVHTIVRGTIYAKYVFDTTDVECTTTDQNITIVKSTEASMTVFEVIFRFGHQVYGPPWLSPEINKQISARIVTFNINGTYNSSSIIPFIRNNRFEVQIDETDENLWDIGIKFSDITYDITIKSSTLTLGTTEEDRAAFTGTVGAGLYAKTLGQLSIGTYNEDLSEYDPLLSIGNGSSAGDRSTAFTVLADGRVFLGIDVIIDPVSGYATGEFGDLYNAMLNNGWDDAIGIWQPGTGYVPHGPATEIDIGGGDGE